MRDAMGAGWIFGICLVFIILFVAYLAITLNYARAFRIKNYIVSEIEENEGYNDNLEQKLETYLTEQGYNAYGVCDPYMTDGSTQEDWALDKCIGNTSEVPANQCSICIYRKIADKQKDKDIRAQRSYYRVVAFFRFDLPVISGMLPAFQVGGDTRYIYDFANA